MSKRKKKSRRWNLFQRANECCRENIAEKFSKEGTCTHKVMDRPKRGPSTGALHAMSIPTALELKPWERTTG